MIESKGKRAVTISEARRSQKAHLAPAIDAMRDRRADAHAISLGELESRFDRARSLMRKTRIDPILLCGGTSLDFLRAFDGTAASGSSRLSFRKARWLQAGWALRNEYLSFSLKVFETLCGPSRSLRQLRLLQATPY